MTRAGRPRGFVEAQVIGGARDVFWLRGYAASSLRDLTEATGLLPGSIYSSFGGKRDLFVRTLEDYAAGARQAADELRAAAPALPAIRAFLVGAVDAARVSPGRGCMLGNTAVELLPEDDTAREIVRKAFHDLEDGLAAALVNAQQDGEIRSDLDACPHARQLLALVQGLHVTARAEADPHRLVDAVDAALDALRPIV
ncbi:TetR/AcrR family transcriptional regulator [Zhihengliuella sp.]|uniref:TetR/AcrR family transcriptional regulator n=1 Tax=Zhihengliuella sp. TaxID=1954483 RepID=UPI00281156A1|nr:TetR/AcrR family transcriptional regulator [Zhihengliuella sp.]